MEEREFTLIDAFNQFWQVWENGDKRSLTCIGLYFYLCKVWNACGRPISFRHQNTLVCAQLSISKPTLDNSRNSLKQMGLIDFYSKGKGDPNITYEIIDIRKEVKKLYYHPQPEEVKKAKNFTSSFTSSFTSPDDIKQSTEYPELIITIGGEVKKFYYLKNLIEADEGCRRRWADFGFSKVPFEDGFTSFMSYKHGTDYPDFKGFRDNFFRWIPSYATELRKKQQQHEPNGNIAPKANGKHHSNGSQKGGSLTSLQALKQRSEASAPGGPDDTGTTDGDGGEDWHEAEVLE